MHVLTSIFTSRISLVTYIDEDENEIPELSSNKTFFIMLRIPEECVNEEGLHHLLTKRVIMPYVLLMEVLTLDIMSSVREIGKALEWTAEDAYKSKWNEPGPPPALCPRRQHPSHTLVLYFTQPNRSLMT